MQDNDFNKKILSLLIEKAKGERTLKAYANDCDISYMQMRKLWLCAQDNPPRKSLITKLSRAAHCGITYEDFAFACGFGKTDNPSSQDLSGKYSILISKLERLSVGQKKTALDFIDFLMYRN